MINHLKFIKKPEAMSTYACSKSTLHNRIIEGLIPPPIPLGNRAVGFFEHEVQAVVAAMGAEKSKDEIRALVISLVEQRQQAANGGCHGQ